MANSRLVYSTSGNNECSRCGRQLSKCRCDESDTKAVLGDGRVRIQLERSGRGGKEVTVISGLPMTAQELKQLAKQLKAKCGCGGSVKAGCIELQGDRREQTQTLLQTQGYDCRISGA